MTKGTKIVFRLQDRVDGAEVTPETIGLAAFNRFNKEVADFINGGDESIVLDEAHVSIEEGSYKFIVFLPLLMFKLIQPDYDKLQKSQSLHDMHPKRLEIIQRWQNRALKNPDYKVSITTNKQYGNSITISSETDFHDDDQDQWVKVEKYITGKLFSQGGKNSANIHITPNDSTKDLIISSTPEYLNSLSVVNVYDTIQVRIEALQNIQTKELKDPHLLEFIGKAPSYDEDELNAAIEKGTKAWADVKDISTWVAEQRGGSYG